MKDESEKIGRIVPEHIAYWRNCNALGYKGWPFADRSGGMISFSVAGPARWKKSWLK